MKELLIANHTQLNTHAFVYYISVVRKDTARLPIVGGLFLFLPIDCNYELIRALLLRLSA